jgi:hypothetical protein
VLSLLTTGVFSGLQLPVGRDFFNALSAKGRDWLLLTQLTRYLGVAALRGHPVFVFH